MFTIKLYSADGFRQVIRQAESFTVLRSSDGLAEITLHQKNPAEDSRVDIKNEADQACSFSPPCFGKAIIENAAGRTTEIIALRPLPGDEPKAYRSDNLKAA
jgi:hypothetical protein